MTSLRVLNSQEDRSVNFVEEQLTGFLESRYVRKCDDYFIAYLSSQTGCNRGCTFCHLTATGQTSFTDSTVGDFLAQANQVFRHYRKQKRARYMHYNFMARGEPLASDVITKRGQYLFAQLADLAADNGLPAKFNVSTIIPRTLKLSLVEAFPYITPTIYYSLYSVDEDWRAKWIPGAMPVPEALRMLKEYQDFSKKVVKIHHALIHGENDSRYDALAVVRAVLDVGLHCEFNLVRYNPASPEQGMEAPQQWIDLYMETIRNYFPGKVQVIPRVGFDVKASCGMFVND